MENKLLFVFCKGFFPVVFSRVAHGSEGVESAINCNCKQKREHQPEYVKPANQWQLNGTYTSLIKSN